MPQELYRIDHDKFRACVDKWDLPSRVADMCKINRQTMYLVYKKKQLTVSKEFMDKWEIYSPFSISQILASPEKKQVYLKQRKQPRETTNKLEKSITQVKVIRLPDEDDREKHFVNDHDFVINAVKKNIEERMKGTTSILRSDVLDLVDVIVLQAMNFGIESERMGYKEIVGRRIREHFSVGSFRGKRY